MLTTENHEKTIVYYSLNLGKACANLEVYGQIFEEM